MTQTALQILRSARLTGHVAGRAIIRAEQHGHTTIPPDYRWILGGGGRV